MLKCISGLENEIGLMVQLSLGYLNYMMMTPLRPLPPGLVVGGRAGLLDPLVYIVFTPCLHQGQLPHPPARRKRGRISGYYQNGRVLTVFAPCFDHVLFLQQWQGGGGGRILESYQNGRVLAVYLPSSHRVRTLFSPCPLSSPLVGREGRRNVG